MNPYLKRYLFCLTAFSSLFIASCSKDTDDKVPDDKINENLVSGYPAEVAVEWNKMFLEIERFAAGYRPGPAPRALGLMGLATYEACISGMPDYNSIASRYSGLTITKAEADTEYHWPTVVHAIYSTMIPRFFPNIHSSVSSRVSGLISSLNSKYLAEAGEELYNRSYKFGQTVGLEMWDWSTTDAVGHDHYKDPFGTYSWQANFKGPGNWKPTEPGPDKPMGAVYGKVRTFAITETDKICLPPSAYYMQYSEDPKSEYYSQALQVYTKNAASSYLVEWIGEYWSDDLLNLTFSPGPRWIAVANQIINIEKSNLETAIEAYAKCGMALNDAAVGCWNSKYYYNIERPDTYIKK
ncbi:MAG: hypothetical protein IPM92_07945 [Saprospiraceae bacterium]|nr:hypothetical protein [Saprospiraceae bacterium]